MTTMMGALFAFISSAAPKHFQPMPPNFGILPELSVPLEVSAPLRLGAKHSPKKLDQTGKSML